MHTQGVELIEPADLSGSIRGRHNIYNHLELVVRNAEKSVTLMTTSQGLLRKIEGLRPTFEKLKKKGVKIRIAAPITTEAKAALADVAELAEVRHTNSKARFCIVDGKELLFMVLDDKDVHPTYDIGIWVNTPFFAGAMENMFNQNWDKMKPATSLIGK